MLRNILKTIKGSQNIYYLLSIFYKIIFKLLIYIRSQRTLLLLTYMNVKGQECRRFDKFFQIR